MLSKIASSSAIESNLYRVLDMLYGSFVDSEESIVITGFPRSGTTFLVEALSKLTGARVVFEPLNCHIAQARPFLHPHIFRNGGDVKLQGFPYRSSAQQDSALKDYFRSVLTGRVDSSWVRRSRSIRSYQTAKVIVKTVRGSLLASWLANTFSCKLLLLIRHPCAVVESILRQKWGWWLQQDKFLSLFLEQDDLVRDWLSPFVSAISRCDSDKMSRIALGYSLANFVPLLQAQQQEFTPLIVRYEDIVMTPETAFTNICHFLDIDCDQVLIRQLIAQPSSSTQESRRDIAAYERCFGWKRRLTVEDQKKITQVVEMFGKPLANFTQSEWV